MCVVLCIASSAVRESEAGASVAGVVAVADVDDVAEVVVVVTGVAVDVGVGDFPLFIGFAVLVDDETVVVGVGAAIVTGRCLVVVFAEAFGNLVLAYQAITWH
ncbi:Hypothetical predicted protein [Octopus vulgaris]|uniref:Uncharacterized protein n=1 Tax=Octopus vulgaris TaxID=6645 RepID=A0AA36ATH6_OCTVU|nr:Hypothetical predicted protein [Octopus vulgaris]